MYKQKEKITFTMLAIHKCTLAYMCPPIMVSPTQFLNELKQALGSRVLVHRNHVLYELDINLSQFHPFPTGIPLPMILVFPSTKVTFGFIAFIDPLKAHLVPHI